MTKYLVIVDTTYMITYTETETKFKKKTLELAKPVQNIYTLWIQNLNWTQVLKAWYKYVIIIIFKNTFFNLFIFILSNLYKFFFLNKYHWYIEILEYT